MDHDDVIETIECDEGIVIEIYRDVQAENPIVEFDDCEAHVSIFSGRYDFGNCDDFKTQESFEEFCRESKRNKDRVYRLPVYCYDHGGVTVSTGAFGCPWDSGQIGWVWFTASEVKEKWGCTKKHIESNLKGTVSLLNDYLTGQVYGYVVKDAQGNELDSCWGFYGDEEYATEEAKSAARYHVEKAKAARVEREARRVKCFAI